MDLTKHIGQKITNDRIDKMLKLEESSVKSWLKTVSAFANTKGGALIFGVSDDDVVVGLDDCQSNLKRIEEIVKKNLDPSPYIVLEIFSEDDKNFIVFQVFSGEKTPYYLVDGDYRAVYVRVGTENLPATRSQIKRLVLKQIKYSADRLISGTPKRFVNFSSLSAGYTKRTGKMFANKDLYSFGLMNKNDELTNAGDLFADEFTINHSQVICTKWRGCDKSEPVKSLNYREFGGGLVNLLDRAIEFIKLHTPKWRKVKGGGPNYPKYLEVSITEAIVNALVHRDYDITEEVIKIDIFDDRMEISSPGGMYDDTLVQEQNPADISSVCRNPLLADIFDRMNLMERRGNGLKKIIEAYESNENYTEDMKPKFISTQTSFCVVLYNLSDKHKKTKNQ